jgi:hypothetical protein
MPKFWQGGYWKTTLMSDFTCSSIKSSGRLTGGKRSPFRVGGEPVNGYQISKWWVGEVLTSLHCWATEVTPARYVAAKSEISYK